MRETGGLVSREDLAAYRTRSGAPLGSRYRDLEVAWSPGATGGVTALETLNILDQFPSTHVAWATPTGLHHRAQAIRQAFLDRFEHLGDPEVVTDSPWERLASRDHARALAGRIRRARGSPGRGEAPATHGDCTTHVCAVDRQRNMVSLTHTAVSTFGSRMVVPGTGILLNNGMIWFDPEPGKPNSVGPGKRAMVNMAPALACRRGQPYLALGAPGGRRIISAIPQVIANLADGARSVQEAIEAPRVHSEGGALDVDVRVGGKALRDLARRGYSVVEREETYAGSFFAKPVGIRVTRRGLEAGLDPWRPAAAAGY
jgi:gamma-glutamyltranspeptidase/glutathione hydrolase